MEKVISSQKGSLSNTNGLPCDLFYWVMTYDIARLYPQGSSSEGKERCGVGFFLKIILTQVWFSNLLFEFVPFSSF